MAIHGMTLHLAENPGVRRSAVVSVKSKISELKLDYTITQAGAMGELKFVYNGASFAGSFPSVTGTTSGATINWGDALSNAWGTFTHNYTDGASSHTISVAMAAMTEVSFTSLANISAIDVSGM